MLEPYGAIIVGEARDGRDCIDKIVDARADLVLLDLKMPGMGGFEALPELRERAPMTKIVVLTTAPSADAEARSLELGASGFVQKPRDIDRLPNELRRVLAG